MLDKRVAQWRRRAVVEENPHLCNSERTAGRVLQYGARLLQRDPWEPLKKLVDRSIVFKVLEQCRDGHASASKDPGATHPRGVALDSGARGPIDQARDGITAGVV